MSTWRPAHTLLVRVGPLSVLPGDAGLRATVTERVTERVAVLAGELGLPLAPHLEVVLDELPGVEVGSDGRTVSARDLDLEEAWRLVAAGEAVPFGWDWQRLAGAVRQHAEGQEMVAELVAEVVAVLLQRRPDRLLTARQAVAFLMHHGGTKAGRLDPESLLRSAGPALALGIGIGDGPRVLDHLATDHAPQHDRVEALLADLRAETVEVAVDPDLAVDPDGQAVSEGFGLLADHLLRDLGVRVPAIRLVANGELAPRRLTVRINSLTGPRHRALPAGTLMVDAPPDELGGRFGTARPVRNPATGGRCSVVDARYAAALREAGRMAWTPPEHVVLTVGGELRRQAAGLVDVRTVEYELSLVFRDSPDLVLEALGVLSLAELTEVARGLVQDGPGIRDLRLVLERLAAFDVLSDAGDRALLDGSPGWQPARTPDPVTPAEQRTRFVRGGLREHLAQRYADGSGRIPAILVGHDVAERLRPPRDRDRDPTTGRALSSAELRHLRETVCRLQQQAGDPWPPVVLTTGEVRSGLASLLVEAVPDVVVLASEELPGGLEVVSRGGLSFAGMDPADESAEGHRPDG